MDITEDVTCTLRAAGRITRLALLIQPVSAQNIQLKVEV